MSFSSSGRTSPSSKCSKDANSSKWVVLGLLWLVCFLNYADRQVISSLFPLLEHDFGFSKAQLGLIGSSFMWVYAFSSPLAGFSGDRVSRKGLILGGCLLWSVMTFFTGLCGKFWQFLATRAVIGLGESLYFPSATSLISGWHGLRTRSTALSLHQSAVYVGTIAGGALGAYVGARYGWRWAFYGFGGAGILVAILIRKHLADPVIPTADLLERDAETTMNTTATNGLIPTFQKLLTKPNVLLLMVAFAFANGVAAIFLLWAPTFLYEKFHQSLVVAGFSAVAAIQIASAVSAPLSGLLADRLSIRIRGARMIVQAVALLLGSLTIVAVGRAATMEALIASMICFGICKGGYDAGIFASVFDLVLPGERSSVAGLMNTLGWIGGAVSAMMVGIFSTYGSGTPMERMSGVIVWSSVGYLVAATLLLSARTLDDTKPAETLHLG